MKTIPFYILNKITMTKNNKIKINNLIDEQTLDSLAEKVLQENINPTDLLKPLLWAVRNKVLEKEMELYLWCKKYERKNDNLNYRNWYYSRKVKSDYWKLRK